MEKSKEFYRHHPDPIVEIWLNTELVPEKLIPALSSPGIASNPKVQALALILMSDAGITSFEEANRFAESVYLVPCHVDLQLIFLALWYGTFMRSQTVSMDQIRAVLVTMNGLISKDTLPEIKAMVNIGRSINCSFEGDFVKVLRISENLLNDIPLGSYFYHKLVILRAMAFLIHGMGSHVEESVKDIDPKHFDGRGLTISRIANCALTANLTKVPELILLLSDAPEHMYRQLNFGTVETACTLIEMMNKVQGFPISSLELINEANHKKSWALSTHALLEYDVEGALHWARTFTDEQTSRIGEPLDFLEYTLVRAELAMRNGSGAKRLLSQLRERGTETFIDDFYFARAELLLGNRDLALKHFRDLSQSVKKYNAQKRFDFEIAIACELGASELLELAKDPIEISQKELSFTPSVEKIPTGLNAIIGESKVILDAKKLVMKFADLDFPVLIVGETGTGKELVARALHEESKRKNKAFIAVNCGSVPDALIESEFFGHSSGAFTGAQSAYKGIFREVGEGTVFLDEIADISAQLQLSLLRVLESGEVRPVGSSTLCMIKCRVIVATNRPLLELVEEGLFRQDLYYRLQRLEVNLPELRSRRGDIEVLLRHFFNCDRNPGEEVILDKEFIERFKKYSWPGNVRELRNTVQRIRILSSDKRSYDVSDLNRCNCILEDKPEIELSEKQVENERPSLNSSFRKKKKLRELFDQFEALKVFEVAEILEVSLNTASAYLVELAKEEIIEKITPTASRKSHYYTKKRV